MNTQLQQFIDAEQLSPAKLADILGVQRSNISHILSGRNKPGFDFIKKLLHKFPQLNPDWVMLNKGNMYRGESNPTPTLFSMENVSDKKEIAQSQSTSAVDEVENIDKIPSTNSNSVDSAHKAPKQVERVMIFYTDNTFDTYTPSN